MKTRTIAIVAAAFLGISAIGALVYAGNEENEKNENKQKLAMTELPAPVQKTIQDNLGGGTITEVAKETKAGKTYYEADVQKASGEKIEVKVAEDGKLIGVGKEDEDNDE
jgi:uncharacterized membrane protein YkoI